MFRILERIYKMYSEPMILNTICTLLIKGNKTQQRYFVWYQRAVDAELKIAQLYEYYMMTIDENVRQEGRFRRSILLYFMHGNTLTTRRRPFYMPIWSPMKRHAGDLYLNYREQMVELPGNQLLKRHITESLRILYKTVLPGRGDDWRSVWRPCVISAMPTRSPQRCRT
ncbi:MAG: DUF5717 family protein [[Clostridium] scindens]